MLRRALLAISLSLAVRALAADPLPAPRVAVIGDAHSKDLVALLTVELSSSPAVALLERDDLQKVGDEAKMQQMAGNDATALGKLIGADGLLFLDQRPDGMHVRFTAVNLGYALLDDAAPSALEPQQEAKALAHLVEVNASKLRLDPTHAIPISVLNLRAASATSGGAELERNLTLLLESRLAAVPEFVVLERRHAWSLNFEHALVAPGRGVLQGAYLIDGSIESLTAASGTITIQLRIRSPKSQQPTLPTIEGSTKDLPGLVEKILARILTSVGSGDSTHPGDSLAEAREYLKEGIWAWHANQPRIALEALDSAELLGETAPDLLATRINTLCQLGGDVTSLYSTGTGVDWMDRHFEKGNTGLPADPRPEERTELLLRAMADDQTYNSANGEKGLSLLTNIPTPNGNIRINYGDTHELQTKVLYASSKVLAMLDALHDSQEDSFRQALRDFAEFDPLHGRMPAGGVFAFDYLGEWSDSADEELAYLHNLCAASLSDYPLRNKLDELLYSTGATDFCPRFAASAKDQKTLFEKFVTDLIRDPATKPVGLAIRVTWDDPAQKAADYHLFLDDLWTERDALLKSSRLEGLVGRAVILQYKISTPADPQLVALFRYILQNHNPGVIGAIMWYPDLFPPADAPSLWNDLEALKARAGASVAKSGPTMAPVFQAAIQGEYSKLEKAYIADWGNPDETATAAPAANSGPLVVNRYWCSWRAVGTSPIVPQQTFYAGGMDGTLWIYAYDHMPQNAVAAVDGYAAVPTCLFQIHLPDLKTTCSLNPRSIAPDGSQPPVMAVGPDAVYIATITNYQPVKCVLDRFQISTRKWDSREMSLMISELFPVGDKIYFTAQGESGLARYDWESGQTILLASSRRRPAQNQFDDRAPYNVASVFAGPDGPCAQIEQANYLIQETPGNWTLQSKLAMFPGIPQDPKVGVFPDPFGLHISTVEPQFQPMSKEFTWYLACREKIDAQRKGDPVGYAYRNGNFFVLGHTDDCYTLWWVEPAKTDPIAIPLKLTIDDATLAGMKSRYGDAMVPILTSPMKSPAATVSMTVTSEGLCLTGEAGGFWFIPFSDIDSYLTAHGLGPSSDSK